MKRSVKMKFDINRVFSHSNADGLRLGDIVILGNDINLLREYVETCGDDPDADIVALHEIRDKHYAYIFSDGEDYFNLAYLVKRAEK